MTEQEKYIVERAMTHSEISNKRLWISTIILTLALIISNACWIYYESQWKYVDTETSFEVEQDGDNNNVNDNVLGDYYGTSESNSKE